MPRICHLKVTSKYTCHLLSNLLFLIVILFMSFHSLGILCRFKSDGMKHNTSGERHVLMKYDAECHHSGDVYQSRDGRAKLRDESVCCAFLNNPHENCNRIIIRVQHHIIRKYLPAEGTSWQGNQVDTLLTHWGTSILKAKTQTKLEKKKSNRLHLNKSNPNPIFKTQVMSNYLDLMGWEGWAVYRTGRFENSVGEVEFLAQRMLAVHFCNYAVDFSHIFIFIITWYLTFSNDIIKSEVTALHL